MSGCVLSSLRLVYVVIIPVTVSALVRLRRRLLVAFPIILSKLLVGSPAMRT